MWRMELFENPRALAGMFDARVYAGFDAECLRVHAPDAHFACMDESGVPQARCSLWWRDTPALPNEEVGLIGHYAAADDKPARALLEHVRAELAAAGCTIAVAPMDGNTWRAYRFVTDPGSEPTFFLEPQNPPQWPAQLVADGFRTLAEYSSALTVDLTKRDPRLIRAWERLTSDGVSVRALNIERFDTELDAIFTLSLESFSQNFMYTRMAREEFHAQYAKVRPLVVPELTLMAEQKGELVGFLFGLPDMAQQARGEKMNTFIIKTVAVRPGRSRAGLGSVLVGEAQARAHEAGFERAIHALMHDSNRSLNISRHYGHTIRRYTLFQRSLRA